jgi:plastocyanin
MRYIDTLRPQRRRAGLAVGGLGLAGLLAAVIPAIGTNTAAAVAAAAHTATIQIDNFAFTPQNLTVTAGTVVTWKNADDSPHRIADVNGAYNSAALDTEDSYSHAFATPGAYKYICSIHPYMKGEITVKPAAAGS